jgi:hypothetical protein
MVDQFVHSFVAAHFGMNRIIQQQHSHLRPRSA